MGTIHKDSVVKNVLKNLCCSYGWSYGVFWSYDQPNSLLLTLQDAYFREEFGDLIVQVPIGGGIIGQAAYTNKHLWISSEDHYNEHNFSGSIWDMFLDDRGFRGQFSAGIKTIAIIPVEPQGVVQLGAKEKILERMEFVNQTKRMFQEIASSSLNRQICHPNGLISSEESCFFDTPPDFGIPNELFQTEDFNLDGFTPADDFLSFIPINSDESMTISGTDVDLLGNNGDLGDILAPGKYGNHSGNLYSYSSECMFVPKPTRQFDCSALGSKERLFSKLGIEELLEGISGISTSCIEGQVAKRRKTGNSMWEGGLLHPVVYNDNFELKKEAMGKSVSGLRMVDGYSVSGSSTVVQAKKQVESKPAKKKAKPGTRPRPKDRQQILDRMTELRQLIPNGEKMSIDCLLDRTIKHMLFLQSVTKQADRIKEADEPKRNGVVSIDPSPNGVTWACELGDQTVVCPLIVEDLGAPGQMLIEMLCEEQGFFLEIVDIVRRFGLIILKGVMEARTDKIWARFIVEPEMNRHVTRHGLFSALVRFLQTIEATSDDNKCGKIGNSLLDDLNRQYGIPNLVNWAEMQYSMNL
ncbi:hypothetical protein L6452_31697 [Arctium lappa]|uniref:Uncharacterized protein n=1 Tax=Arctium lappa TaxID=4217 RepID=A0ACB8Z2L5_ARCLA|nr:hypothetical protein L6452_31697 [Arctium lappa]